MSDVNKKLPKIVEDGEKRLGRGYGSGKGGHTTNRGQKGQKSRTNLNILFEGLKVKKSLLKRLPQLRGKDKFKPKTSPVVLNVEDLNDLRAGSKVNIETLVKEGLVDEKKAKEKGVKILGTGKLEKKLTVAIPVSASAKKKIEKAGGKVIDKE